MESLSPEVFNPGAAARLDTTDEYDLMTFNAGLAATAEWDACALAANRLDAVDAPSWEELQELTEHAAKQERAAWLRHQRARRLARAHGLDRQANTLLASVPNSYTVAPRTDSRPWTRI